MWLNRHTDVYNCTNLPNINSSFLEVQYTVYLLFWRFIFSTIEQYMITNISLCWWQYLTGTGWVSFSRTNVHVTEKQHTQLKVIRFYWNKTNIKVMGILYHSVKNNQWSQTYHAVDDNTKRHIVTNISRYGWQYICKLLQICCTSILSAFVFLKGALVSWSLLFQASN